MTSNRVTANLPSRDFDTTETFYSRLGFSTRYRGEDWMILGRDTLEIEFFAHPGLDPAESWFSACLRHDDMDALYAEWSGLGLATEAPGFPRIGAPVTLDGAPRMFFLHDPDGSLWRIIDNGDTM